MKKHFREIGKQTFVIFWAFVLMSCAAQSIIIEIPQKSKNELPESIQSVLLVSRVADETYSNLSADSIQRIFYLQNFNYDTIIKDSMVIDTTIKAMGEILFGSGRYDYVIPENRFLPSEKNTLLIKELPWSEVDDLCETYNTDALISLDYLKTSISTSFNRESNFNPFQGGFYSVIVAKMSIKYEALIRVYDPAQEKILVRKLLQDTLFWEDYDNSINALFSRFTPVKNALMETGIATALDFTDEITPNWKREWRNFFSGGDNRLKEAALLVRNNQWDSAMAIWGEIENNAKSKSLKSKVELNIALGYEMRGDLNKAIEWAVKSYNTMYHPNTYEYLEILKRRINEQ